MSSEPAKRAFQHLDPATMLMPEPFLLICEVWLFWGHVLSAWRSKAMCIESLHVQASKLMRQWGLQNTYFMAKSLSERLVMSYDKQPFPVCIVRPSLIGCVAGDPFPGYIGNSSGFTSLVLGSLAGMLWANSIASHWCSLSTYNHIFQLIIVRKSPFSSSLQIPIASIETANSTLSLWLSRSTKQACNIRAWGSAAFIHCHWARLLPLLIFKWGCKTANTQVLAVQDTVLVSSRGFCYDNIKITAADKPVFDQTELELGRIFWVVILKCRYHHIHSAQSPPHHCSSSRGRSFFSHPCLYCGHCCPARQAFVI